MAFSRCHKVSCSWYPASSSDLWRLPQPCNLRLTSNWDSKSPLTSGDEYLIYTLCSYMKVTATPWWQSWCWHLNKIPPRSMFWAQVRTGPCLFGYAHLSAAKIAATLIAGTTQLLVQAWWAHWPFNCQPRFDCLRKDVWSYPVRVLINCLEFGLTR